MLLPHLPVKGPLHFICFGAQPALKLLFLWFLDPLWIVWTGDKMALQASLVGEGFLAGNTMESLPLVRWLMGSQLRLFQELPATHIAIIILEGADVFLCLGIVSPDAPSGQSCLHNSSGRWHICMEFSSGAWS